jgi:hypothetical protein
MKINPNTIKQKKLEDRDFVLVANEEKVYKVKKSEVVPTATTNDEYQETIVNISSAQILAMGDNPIELLPATTEGQYYDIEKIILEYIPNTISYNVTSDFVRLYYGNLSAAISSKIIGADNVYIALITDLKHRSNVSNNTFIPEATDILYGGGADGILALTSYDGNPTDGDGTLRAIIKYKVRTVGE